MTQGIWGLYKARVLQTLGGARADGALQEEVMGGGGLRLIAAPCPPPALTRLGSLQGDPSELMEAAEPPALMEEGSGPVSQLARKVRIAAVGAAGIGSPNNSQ